MSQAADAVHDAGHLSVLRSAGEAGRWRWAHERARQRRTAGAARRVARMSVSTPFIQRPVATTLLTIGLALVGIVASFLLPVAPMPNVDIPTIVVPATLPGASPDTVATSVTTPLERHLGAIAGVDEMTSQSSVGSARIVLRFELSRDIDGAARDVQGRDPGGTGRPADHAAKNPSYRTFNPVRCAGHDPGADFRHADHRSDLRFGLDHHAAEAAAAARASAMSTIGGSSLPAVRVELNPRALFQYGIGLEDVRAAHLCGQCQQSQGRGRRSASAATSSTSTTPLRPREQYRSLIIAYRNNAPVRLGDIAQSATASRTYAISASPTAPIARC